MKVRVGFGCNTGLFADQEAYAHVVDELERLRFDSLWVTERVNNATLDPVVAMTFAAARTTKLKVGAGVIVLPGRNPVLLAKALSSLDKISNGRCLPAFGLGIANSAEHQAFGVERKQRGRWFDEALPLMRRLWTEEVVTHAGERFDIAEVRVEPKPVQDPFDIWLGGASDIELRRVGRLADGWLPSFITPQKMATGMQLVQQTAADHDREIDDEHYGVLIPYIPGEIPPQLAEVVKVRAPEATVDDIVARSIPELRDLVARFIDIGASKFVVFPFAAPPDWTEELEALSELLDLHT